MMSLKIDSTANAAAVERQATINLGKCKDEAQIGATHTDGIIYYKHKKQRWFWHDGNDWRLLRAKVKISKAMSVIHDNQITVSGERLYLMRKSLQLSQEQAAKGAGISSGTIARIEHGSGSLPENVQKYYEFLVSAGAK